MVKLIEDNAKKIALVAFVIMAVITLLTSYYGSTDIGDYADSAKYFAGDYSAKIRSSHSYLFGFILSPFVKLFGNFVIFKITSLIFLALLILSVYYISGKNKKALLLISLSPIVWYMAPWIGPIQLSSVLFLWAYHFIKKYRETDLIRWLFLSSILVGLSWAVWDAIIFFGAIFAFAFMYDRKMIHSLLFMIGVIVGLLPKLILDNYILGFAFVGLIKYAFGQISSIFLSGIYGNVNVIDPLRIIFIIFFIPLAVWELFRGERWKNNRNMFIFIALCLLLIAFNAQIRYALLIVPMMLVEISKFIDSEKVKRQLIVSLIIVCLVVAPYIIQVNHSSNALDFKSLLMNVGNLEIGENPNLILEKSLVEIARDYPNVTFVVGNAADDYQALAHSYWGNGIVEFVSMQDYDLWKNNESILFEKKLSPIPRINERRQLFFDVGMKKSENDKTDYPGIKYALGINEPIREEGFNFVQQYGDLYLSAK